MERSDDEPPFHFSNFYSGYCILIFLAINEFILHACDELCYAHCYLILVCGLHIPKKIHNGKHNCSNKHPTGMQNSSRGSSGVNWALLCPVPQSHSYSYRLRTRGKAIKLPAKAQVPACSECRADSEHRALIVWLSQTGRLFLTPF